MGARVLVCHPDGDLRARWVGLLRRAGHEVDGCAPGELTERLADGTEVVVAGHRTPGAAIDLCERLASEHPAVAWIPATREADVGSAVRALRLGAADYFVVDRDPPRRLREAVDRVVEGRYVRTTLERLESSPPTAPPSGLVGVGDAIQIVRRRIADVAQTSVTVLITGETGTGKEVVARAIHDASGRAGPFVVVNCAALVGSLLESELFGHERGAFTGAARRHGGLFLEADGGTLLLDEIGAMPLDLQAKLLRVLEERAVRPVGGDREVAVDVRVLAATNSDLTAEARAGRFRVDLLYRLDVLRIEVPPLRERTEDLLPLSYVFLRRAATETDRPVVGLTEGAARRLLQYDWPGNVRELEGCLQRAVAFAQLDRITERDLPDRVGPRYREGPPRRLPSEELVPLEMMECAHLARVMREADGNKSLAARILGIDRKTLYRKLDRHGLMDLARDDSVPADETAPGTHGFGGD